MSNMNPSHDIFNKPGDEGSAPSYQDVSKAGETNWDGGSHEHVHKPGSEGSENDPESPAYGVQGYQVTPPAPLDSFQKGQDVRKTYIAPKSGSDPTPGMPGA